MVITIRMMSCQSLEFIHIHLATCYIIAIISLFEDKAFNFHEFFRTFTGDFSKDYADMPEGAEVGDFVHEADVWSFLNLMTTEDEHSQYPYSNTEYRSLFKHSLWMVPGVKKKPEH